MEYLQIFHPLMQRLDLPILYLKIVLKVIRYIKLFVTSKEKYIQSN